MEILRGDDMGFTKITSNDTTGKGVTGLPDTPGLETLAMQRKFDELSLDVIIPKFNAFLEELEKDSAAGSIGAKVPEGIDADNNVQSILERIVIIVADALEKATSANNTANNAASKINKAVTVVNQIAYMIDPVTGQLAPINQIINNIYNTMRPAPLTADAYATLNLTADAYALYQISAYDYAMFGANILGK